MKVRGIYHGKKRRSEAISLQMMTVRIVEVRNIVRRKIYIYELKQILNC